MMSQLLARNASCSHLPNSSSNSIKLYNGINLFLKNGKNNMIWPCIVAATVKNLKPPPRYDDVEFPPDRRKLKMLQKVPYPTPGMRPQKMMKRLTDIRGPELIHNKLIHKQYGLQATVGGNMKWGHIEVLRNSTNKRLNDKYMFAIWRIDSPWKPITKKGLGVRMGGGKGGIDEYVTPVKAGRMLIELGGHLEYEEAFYLLRLLANLMPVRARPVSQTMLEEEAAYEEYREKNNLNPLTFKNCLENNILGCRTWASPYDHLWHNKYR